MDAKVVYGKSRHPGLLGFWVVFIDNGIALKTVDWSVYSARYAFDKTPDDEIINAVKNHDIDYLNKHATKKNDVVFNDW